MKAVLFIVALAFASLVRGGDFDAAFAVVMIDRATEAKFGAFPYDRTLIAKAVDACARGRAKAVVLKFFFDRPRSTAGDLALRDAMTRIPVVLQARIERSEGTIVDIPKRFRAGEAAMATAVRGEHGWIPLPQFMEKAAAVGFVDFDSPAIPLIEEYRGVAYKSLVLCCVEFAMDSTARVTPRGIQVGGGVLPVDELSIFRATIAQPDVQYMSFADLVSDRAELSRLERRVVIIGWDSDKTPVIMTEHGKMTIHRFFVACVATAFHAAKG